MQVDDRDIEMDYRWTVNRETNSGIGRCKGDNEKDPGQVGIRDIETYMNLFGTTPDVVRSLGNAEEAT